MCKEAKEYLAVLDNLSGEPALAYMRTLTQERPFVFAEMKGMSIARAVLTQLNEGLVPRPPILTVQEGDTQAWNITKGFLNRIGAASIYEVPYAPQLTVLGAMVGIEEVPSRSQLLDYEEDFSRLDLATPAVRLRISPVSISGN